MPKKPGELLLALLGGLLLELLGGLLRGALLPLLFEELLLELLDELIAEAVPALRAIAMLIAPAPATTRVNVLALGTTIVHLIFIGNLSRGRPPSIMLALDDDAGIKTMTIFSSVIRISDHGARFAYHNWSPMARIIQCPCEVELKLIDGVSAR